MLPCCKSILDSWQLTDWLRKSFLSTKPEITLLVRKNKPNVEPDIYSPYHRRFQCVSVKVHIINVFLDKMFLAKSCNYEVSYGVNFYFSPSRSSLWCLWSLLQSLLKNRMCNFLCCLVHFKFMTLFFMRTQKMFAPASAVHQTKDSLRWSTYGTYPQWKRCSRNSSYVFTLHVRYIS